MKRFQKKVAVPVLSAILLASTSVPAIATEASTLSFSEESVTTSQVTTLSSKVGSFIKTFVIVKAGKTLGNVDVRGSAKTFKYRVNGSGGIVILKVTNRSTGESRTFTAIGNGTWCYATYITPISPGKYDISVVSASGSGHNSVTIYFYS